MVQSLQQFIVQDLNVKPTISPAAEYRARVDALKGFIRARKVKGVVLELDGDRQSTALAGSIAKRAVAELRVETGDRSYRFIALVLPYTNELTTGEEKAALDFVKPDNVFSHSIKTTVSSMMEKHPELLDASDRNTENMVTRVRTTMKHSYARSYNLVVLGAGNAVEHVAGEETRYGNSVCDFLPLSGLAAHQVTQMLHYLNAPSGVCAAVPTAGVAGVSAVTVDKYLAGKEVGEEDSNRIERMFLATGENRRKSVAPFFTALEEFKAKAGSKVLAYA